MSVDETDVILGGRAFRVRPLTIAQVSRIEPLLADAALQAQPINFAVSVLRVGLARDHGEVDFEQVEATVAELGHAMNAVLKLGGFVESVSGPIGRKSKRA